MVKKGEGSACKGKAVAETTERPKRFKPKVREDGPPEPPKKKKIVEEGASKEKKRAAPEGSSLAPKKSKKKAPAASPPPPPLEYDEVLFPSLQHSKNFTTMFSSRHVLLERNLELPANVPGNNLLSLKNRLACTEVHEAIIARKWTHMLPIKFSGYTDIVREFYCNMSPSEYTSYVRGQIVDFSPSSIIALLGIPYIEQHCRMTDFVPGKIYSDIYDQVLCMGKAQWLESKRADVGARALVAGSMTIKARIWWVFVVGILLPISHHYYITHTCLWCLRLLMEDKLIDVGLTMAHQMIFLHNQNLKKGALSYVGIISQLCVNFGVDVDGLAAIKVSRPMTLKYVFGEPATNALPDEVPTQKAPLTDEQLEKKFNARELRTLNNNLKKVFL